MIISNLRIYLNGQIIWRVFTRTNNPHVSILCYRSLITLHVQRIATNTRNRNREFIRIAAIHNIQLCIRDCCTWLANCIFSLKWYVLHHALLIHITDLTRYFLLTNSVSYYLVQTVSSDTLTIHIILWCIRRVNCCQDNLCFILITLHHVIRRRNHISIKLVYTQVGCVCLCQQEANSTTFNMTNITLQLCQYRETSTHWHLME